MADELNNDSAPTPEGTGSVNFEQMTVAEMEYARRNGRLTPEQEQALEQRYQQVTGTPLKDPHDPSKGDSLADQFLRQKTINKGEVLSEALATVPDGEEGFGSDPVVDNSGAFYDASNVADYFDPLDRNHDGVFDSISAPRRADNDVYGGAEQNRMPLEERLAAREADKALHPERFEHKLFDGTKQPTSTEHDKALTEFADKAKAAVAAGPEAVEALLADPKNRALIASTSPEKNSIASNLIKNLSADELKKLDPAKLSVDPQSTAAIQEKLAQPADAPAPTGAKPLTPAEEAQSHIDILHASMRRAGAADDPRLPPAMHGNNYAGAMPKIIDLTRENKPMVAANGQPVGKTPTPDQGPESSVAFKKDPIQQHGKAQARNQFTPGLGLGGGPKFSSEGIG